MPQCFPRDEDYLHQRDGRFVRKRGADVQEVARGIGLDERIGPKFLNAGPGFGGSCFPKDTLALSKLAREFGLSLRLVEATITVNEQRIQSMAKKIISANGGSVRGKTIAILGLTFKPNTDDLREAPSLAIIKNLQNAGARIAAYDPVGMRSAKVLTDGVKFCSDAYDAALGADAIVLVTEWPAFRVLDLVRLRALMAGPVFVDLRNVYSREEVADHGFAYFGLGKPSRSGSGTSTAPVTKTGVTTRRGDAHSVLTSDVGRDPEQIETQSTAPTSKRERGVKAKSRRHLGIRRSPQETLN